MAVWKFGVWVVTTLKASHRIRILVIESWVHKISLSLSLSAKFYLTDRTCFIECKFIND